MTDLAYRMRETFIDMLGLREAEEQVKLREAQYRPLVRYPSQEEIRCAVLEKRAEKYEPWYSKIFPF